MPTGATPVSVVNAAIELTGTQQFITSLTDGSTAANAAAVVYPVVVQLLLRQLDPDFARVTGVLAPVVGATYQPFSVVYTYPSDCLRMRQITPPASGTGALADPFDPLPISWQVAYAVGGGGSKIIATNQQDATGTYTTANTTEAMWDSAFLDAVTRRLGNPLAMAIAGRPDYARELLEQSERYAGTRRVM